MSVLPDPEEGTVKFTNNTGEVLHIPSLDVTVPAGGEFEATAEAAESFKAQGFPRATVKAGKASEKEA